MLKILGFEGFFWHEDLIERKNIMREQSDITFLCDDEIYKLRRF